MQSKFFFSFIFYLTISFTIFSLQSCNESITSIDVNEPQISVSNLKKNQIIEKKSLLPIYINLINSGSTKTYIENIFLSEGSESFGSKATGDCINKTLDILESCNIYLSIDTSTNKNYSLILNIEFNNEEGSLSKSLTVPFQVNLEVDNIGTTPPPEEEEIFIPGEISLIATPQIFDLSINGISEQRIEFKNIGTEIVRIDEYWISQSNNYFTVNRNTCGENENIIYSNESCYFDIQFSGAPTPSDYTGELNLGYYAGHEWNWTSEKVTLKGHVPDEIEPVPNSNDNNVPLPTHPPVIDIDDGTGHLSQGKLHIEGRFLKDSMGNIVTLKGVNIADPEHLNNKPWERPGISAMSITTNAVENYNAKVIRLPIHPGEARYPNEGFFGLNGGINYINNHIKPLVDYLTEKKVYTIIDLHYVADWSDKYAKVEEFWNIVSPIFKNNPYVFYEVFNEPINPDSWDRWKDELAQPIVNLIRTHAPENIIIVGGPYWSSHMAGALNNPIIGENIMYAGHIYSNQWPNHIDKNFGRAIYELPFFITEWGYETGGTEGGNRTYYGIPFSEWLEDNQLSWTAWCFDNKWGPRMFDNNWNLLTGEYGMGELVRELLK